LIRTSPDPWLSEVMGRPVYRLEADSDDGLDDFAARAGGERRAFYYVKVPTDRVAVVQALSRVGFCVVDTNVTFAMKPPSTARTWAFDVGECTPNGADAVLDIAGSCFRYTRFHLDPLVSDAVAHHIKREWVKNYVLKRRGDRLLVAYCDGQAAGFLAALVADRAGLRTAIIDLVGVGAPFQRRGVGESLVNAFIEHYRASCERLAVGSQVANIPSARLYEKLGFSLAASEYVLHKHVPEG
jgi:GNAT superfamily N-acetyltransferase